MSREIQHSIATCSMFVGYRFSPTDEELISHYLKHKIEGDEELVQIIPEIEIWKYEPWDLPAKSIIQSNKEWYFFSPREKKYPRGSQSQRATNTGYWKSTGKERDIKVGSNVIGRKRTLVFYAGRPRKAQRTEWLMHEFSMNLEAQDFMVLCRLRKNSGFLLNDIPSPPQQLSVPASPSPNIQTSRQQLSALEDFLLNDTPMEQSSVPEGARAEECYNPPSVEQIYSGSEAEERFENEFFQHDSSSPHKDYDDDDDCFAEIIKDDIVTLDSFLSTTPNLVPMVATNSEDKGKSKEPVVVPSFQNPADQIMELKQRKPNTCYGQSSEVKHPSPEEQRPMCVASLFSNKMSQGKFRWLRCLFLVMLTWLILFGGSWLVLRKF